MKHELPASMGKVFLVLLLTGTLQWWTLPCHGHNAETWPAPTVLEGVDKQDVLAGETITLRAPTAGIAGYNYQRMRGATEVSATTNETLMLASIHVSQRFFRIVVP